jgi:hypothetical protein
MAGMESVEWSEVISRLGVAKVYWVHTTNPTGAPDASPVWAVTLDEVWYFYSQRSSVKARNLLRDTRVVVHLESGADVVIVHGRVRDVGDPAEHPRVVEAFDHKYHQPDERPFLPSSDPAFDVLYALQPHRVLMWSLPDTEASTRRWTAPRSDARP